MNNNGIQKTFKKVLFRRKLFAKLADVCRKPFECTGTVFAVFFPLLRQFYSK